MLKFQLNFELYEEDWNLCDVILPDVILIVNNLLVERMNKS